MAQLNYASLFNEDSIVAVQRQGLLHMRMGGITTVGGHDIHASNVISLNTALRM